MYGTWLKINKPQRPLQKLPFDQVLFLLGVFVKQFYLLPSGSLQIGDVLMLGSFGCYFFIKKRFRLQVFKDEWYLLLYLGFIALINGTYYVVYNSFGFFKPTLYYLFNILILLVFVVYIQGEKANAFLGGLRKVLQCGMILQAAMFLLGLGKWYGGVRYEGTFNDPNQYGTFILFSVLIIYMTGRMFEKKNGLWLLLGFLLILPSASSGMLIGYFAFLATTFAVNNYRTQKKKVLLVMLAMILLAAIVAGFAIGYLKVPSFIQEMNMYKRFFGKFESFFDENAGGSLMADRAWNRVWKYPQYLLYGAGEGKFDRFGSFLEIHSSVLGPLFYYGIIPFSFFAYWCIRKLKGIGREYISVYVALLAVAVFIVSTRQPMFWMILALAGNSLVKKRREKVAV